jgi:hypothetical protein
MTKAAPKKDPGVVVDFVVDGKVVATLEGVHRDRVAAIRREHAGAKAKVVVRGED